MEVLALLSTPANAPSTLPLGQANWDVEPRLEPDLSAEPEAGIHILQASRMGIIHTKIYVSIAHQ